VTAGIIPSIADHDENLPSRLAFLR
jgi:hypothetical protein